MNNTTTAAALTPGTTVLLFSGSAKVERTVKSVTDTVDPKTMELLEVTAHWTNGESTNYLPDAEFTVI